MHELFAAPSFLLETGQGQKPRIRGQGCLPVNAVKGIQLSGRHRGRLKELRYVFTKDGKFQLEKSGEAQLEGTYMVDPSKQPKQIDYKIEKAAAEAWKGTTSLGIYELDGD